jgi:hypothetical protein
MAVWQRWDEQPGSRDRALAMDKVCTAAAAELGLSANQFRERITAGRRAGLSRGGALDRALEHPPVGP